MNEYERLRELLLQNETEAIAELEKRVDELIQETSNHDLIIQRLTPIISDILKETIASSSDKIAKAMAPIMGDAIKEQVKTQKQSIVDALYPVVGNMIAKFVSSALRETLNEINAKVQDNLSFAALKRKITARIKGIDESELLLRESSLGIVETIFLIHKDSGLLIWQGSKNEEEVVEAEMVSSMLSAIRSFVNDWIAQKDDTYELNTIDYGDSKILLEVSGSCYLAVVIRGEIGMKIQERVTNIFTQVMEEHGDALGEFDGDREKIDIESVAKKLRELFDVGVVDLKKEQKRSKWFLYLLFVALLSSIGYYSVRNYIVEKKESIVRDKFYHSPQLTVYRLNADIDGDKIILKGIVPTDRLKNLAEKLVRDASLDLKIVNDIVVSDALTLPEAIETQMRLLDEVYNKAKDVEISSRLKNHTIIVGGKVGSFSKKYEVVSSYAKIKGVTNVIDAIDVVLAPIKEKIYFKRAKWKLDSSQKEILQHIIDKYDLVDLSKLDGLRLDISAYADGIGSEETNRMYAQKRARSVKEYFVKHSVQESFLTTHAYPYPPKECGQIQDKNEARVAKFQWIYKNGK